VDDGSETGSEAGSEAGRRRFRARCCTSCGLRFPIEDGSEVAARLGSACPVCRTGTTELVDEAYVTHTAPAQREHERGPQCVIGALVDNVRSLSNVGTIVRTADGVGAELLVLAGITPTPAHPSLAKTSLGAERTVTWRARPDPLAAARECRDEGWRLWAIEAGPRATSLFDPEVRAAAHEQRVMLVLGHEVSGVDPRIVELCERVLFLPMLGHKGSLNVSVAFGIAAYALRFG
jgi:23S rRNA (guanosine2251-2'-O)-methyltransferase